MFLTKLKVAGAMLATVSVFVLGLGVWGPQDFNVVLFAQDAKTTAPGAKIDKVPETMHGFSGELVGKVVSRDAEKGNLVLEVRVVSNVWKNNKATNPKSCVGKTHLVEGVFGKFLDALLLLKEGDGVIVEAKHVRGDNLTFLGEVLQKADLAAYEKKAGKKEKD